LTGPGQVATTDFFTIYTAELIRHNMVNLDPAKDPWEIDIGEVTMLTAYGAAAGQVMVNGQLVTGSADVYGKKAIGDTRKDFTKLASGVTAFEQNQHPNLIKSLVQLTDIQEQPIQQLVGNDIFRRVFVYVNLPQYESTVKAESIALNDAIVSMLTQIRADSAQITAYIKSH
jgi:hypothetical protein